MIESRGSQYLVEVKYNIKLTYILEASVQCFNKNCAQNKIHTDYIILLESELIRRVPLDKKGRQKKSSTTVKHKVIISAAKQK